MRKRVGVNGLNRKRRQPLRRTGAYVYEVAPGWSRRSSTNMPNGHDPAKPTPDPGAGAGKIKPDGGTDKPPQFKLAVAAGVGGLIGGVVGAMIDSRLRR